MRALLPTLFLLTLLASCKGRDEVLTSAAMQRQVDSIVAQRMTDIRRRAAEDLDQRMTITMREKTDSIINARRAAIAKDTAHPAPAPAPPTVK